MRRRAMLLTVAAAIAALASPLAAQTIAKANVPFDFQVLGRVLPAGEYSFARQSLADNRSIRITGDDATAYVGTATFGSPARAEAGTVKLIFHRYENQYFLAAIEDGYRDTALTLPQSKQERELARTASAGRYQTVAVFARR